MPGSNFYHYNAIKIRLNGVGNLLPTLIGLDNLQTYAMVAIAMATSPGLEPVRLCNLITQRARLQLKTTAINEVMTINSITVFNKVVKTAVPG